MNDDFEWQSLHNMWRQEDLKQTNGLEALGVKLVCRSLHRRSGILGEEKWLMIHKTLIYTTLMYANALSWSTRRDTIIDSRSIPHQETMLTVMAKPLKWLPINSRTTRCLQYRQINASESCATSGERVNLMVDARCAITHTRHLPGGEVTSHEAPVASGLSGSSMAPSHHVVPLTVIQ